MCAHLREMRVGVHELRHSTMRGDDSAASAFRFKERTLGGRLRLNLSDGPNRTAAPRFRKHMRSFECAYKFLEPKQHFVSLRCSLYYRKVGSEGPISGVESYIGAISVRHHNGPSCQSTPMTLFGTGTTGTNGASKLSRADYLR